MNSAPTNLEWAKSPSARERSFPHTDPVFNSLFERSADAIWLLEGLDRRTVRLIDCNQAAVQLVGAADKAQVLRTRLLDFSAALQLDGTSPRDTAAQFIARMEQQPSYRFEWMLRRLDGREVPIEVSATAVALEGRTLYVVVSRDISERKKAEAELRELNQTLEKRVAERTAELSASEARFRALVEHAPEAIVVYSAETGRFLFGNQHACDLYGVPMSRLAELTPADVSPEFQACGRRSSEVAREKVLEVLAGGRSVFEWLHQQSNGRIISTEVRLLRLPAEGQNLIRASIMDNTERKRAEDALRQSEEKFRALFEGSSQGVVLQDEHQILEVNSAAVRIMGCRSAQELVGKHPGDTSPPVQPNGESSAVLARKYIQQCVDKGNARFEWMSRSPSGEQIPLEVALTRIQWSGRQVIQGFITDITERQRAQAALAESEARFSAAFQASPILIAIGRLSDECFVLVNDAFVNWTGYSREEILGCNTTEFPLWESREDRDAVWAELRRRGSIRERECRLRNRQGKVSTLLMSFEIIQLNCVPHALGMAYDITHRKQAEAELRASEARLRESEARFSAAFQASPAFIGILRISDEKYVLANDAFLNWLGYPAEEVLGRTCVELGIWENLAERDAVLKEMRAAGSIRQRECRWKNRYGQRFTILLSAETIRSDDEPHMLSMALDITQRKRAEEELLKTLQREKELSQLKTNFVSMVSHEFRTPLGILQSSGELLRDFYQRMTAGEREEQLESIIRNTRRMAGMMEEILVLSRLDAGKLDFRPCPLDFAAFCRRVVDEVLSATQHRCPIELKVRADLPAANADERLLGHIFTNLLSNAVKYSATGTAVQFSIVRRGADAVCVIRDQGIGIPATDQARLFSAFHRGANVGNRPGTGLGLVLVKRCVELHQGQVQLKSTPERGTIVTTQLPVFSP